MQLAPLAPLPQAALVETLEILLDLLQLEECSDLGPPFNVLFLQPFACQDDERLGDFHRVAAAKEQVFHFIQMLMDHLPFFWKVTQHPLEVLYPIPHVPRLVLHH